MSFVNNHPITGEQCTIRNSTPLSELNSGMGDIFIRLAKQFILNLKQVLQELIEKSLFYLSIF